MRRASTIVLFCALLAIAATPVAAQSVAITAGTPGIGGEVGADLGTSFGLRATGAYFSLSHGVSTSDIQYDGHARLMSFGLLGDIYLFNSGFRLSGGAMLDRNRLNVTASPAAAVTLGSTSYTPAQLGQITGHVGFSDVAPYAGFGYTSGRGGRGFAFTSDLGVMFTGGPRVALVASGPATALPGFAADLAVEEQKIHDQLDWLRFYPVVKIGVLYRF